MNTRTLKTLLEAYEGKPPRRTKMHHAKRLRSKGLMDRDGNVTRMGSWFVVSMLDMLNELPTLP